MINAMKTYHKLLHSPPLINQCPHWLQKLKEMIQIDHVFQNNGFTFTMYSTGTELREISLCLTNILIP